MHRGVFRCICHCSEDGYVMKTRDVVAVLTVVCCLFGVVHDGSYPEVMDGCKQN